MDEILYTHILKGIGITAGLLGIFVGIDLIFGGRIVSISKQVLEKSFDFDKWLRQKLDKSINFDKIITNPKVRLKLGIVFFALSLVIFLLTIRV
ncbi:MAG: hypothetical protein PVI33_00050 [Candidatus Omnitrophota bacterium]|jgi:hypothetical protein